MLLVQFASDFVHHTVPHFTDLNVLHHWQQAGTDLSWLHLAKLEGQQFDTDVFRGTRVFFTDFLRSGKLWAVVIGIGIGYFIGKMTTYG
jgi:hypothetical protein